MQRDSPHTIPGRLPTGEAVLTTGGNLKARYVIHTAGPIYGSSGGRDAELLAACYRNCLALAVEHNLKTLAFPSISTGAYGYPREEAAKVSSEAIREFLKNNDSIEKVHLVFFRQRRCGCIPSESEVDRSNSAINSMLASLSSHQRQFRIIRSS